MQLKEEGRQNKNAPLGSIAPLGLSVFFFLWDAELPVSKRNRSF